MGFLRQAAKPQHSTALLVISSIWKAECDWKCSQGQKLNRAFIWVSQLCSDPVPPPTQNDDLHTSLLPASSAPASQLSCNFAEVLGCTLQPGLLSVNVRPQNPDPAPLLEHLCYSPAIISSTLQMCFPLPEVTLTLWALWPSWEAAGEVRWRSVWMWCRTRRLHAPNLKNYFYGVELKRIQKHIKLWECLGMKAEKMSPCHNLMHQFFALGCSLHNLCHHLCAAAHVLLWGRMSSSSLVRLPVSNEFPASVKAAGKPCKAFHHRTTWWGHGRTAGDDEPSGSSLMTTGTYLQNSQNPAVGRQPGLPLAAVDYWSFHCVHLHLIFQGWTRHFFTQRSCLIVGRTG